MAAQPGQTDDETTTELTDGQEDDELGTDDGTDGRTKDDDDGTNNGTNGRRIEV